MVCTGISHTQSKDQEAAAAAAAAETTKRRHESDLYVRPSWTDAAIALDQLEKGKADGQRSAVWMRARLQDQLNQLGNFLQRHAGKVLFVAILALATFCVALKSVQVHSKVEQLWVQEGGRLTRELKYAAESLGEAASSTHQLVIQTPKNSEANILQASALKEHLLILQEATQVTINLFEITWGLKDICYAPTIPSFEMYFIDQIFDKIIPCAIITPLDCFWEGSKLLGPDYPVPILGEGGSHLNVRWTNLDPMKLVAHVKKNNIMFPYDVLEDYMKRSGITNGYQTKPCLDPMAPDCPEMAPNKKSHQLPDIGAELTGGCFGFAANHMHWPEALVVGGARHNQTGHLIRAAALQTVVQLMGEREVYEYHMNTYKIHHIDWSQDKAAQVLDMWQRAFSNRVKKLQKQRDDGSPILYNSYAFSTTTMNDILAKYSEISIKNIAIACGLVIVYAGLALNRWRDSVRSQAGVAVAGVFLICATVAAGLGFCSLLGISFNAVTTQIVPFLVLGLGVYDMFLLTHTYATAADSSTGVIVKQTGLSVLLKGLCTVAAFFAASIIPIPALRVFSLQAAILLLFCLGAMLLIFPAMISLDLRRRQSGRSDIFCCCLPAFTITAEQHQEEEELHEIDDHGDGEGEKDANDEGGHHQRRPCRRHCHCHCRHRRRHGHCSVGELDKLTGVDGNSSNNNSANGNEYCNFSLDYFASKYYAPFVTRPATKVLGIMLFALVLGTSLWKTMKVEDGLELGDLVPQNSDEHNFLVAQNKYFGFYSMYAVTGRDFEYPNNQKLLYQYHDAFMHIKNVEKNDDGGLPKFWLSLFRDWLKDLQSSFDKDYREGRISQERWYQNATDKTVLAYKLLVQTGHVDNPIDKTLVTRVRLVDSDGIINPRAFYNYLSAWASNDALAYGASQAKLVPQPREWIFTRDHELMIPKSLPLTWAQMPFYLHRLTDTKKITELIASVRKVCSKFEERGLPNFPTGIPFLFWEQYMELRNSLYIALLAALGASVAIVGILLLNIWAALLVGISLAGVVLQLFGVLGLLDIKLCAISAVLLVISVGITIYFTADICLSFTTSVGASRDCRVRRALQHMFAPLIHGAVTIVLGVAMLAFSDFEFIIRYFFLILSCVVGVGMVNGLFFFPILLSLVGPSPEVVAPKNHPDRISTPTPPASPAIIRRRQSSKPPPEPPRRPHNHHHHHRQADTSRLHTEPSLTTITEEPNSWHSTQESCIIVQPEVKVETTSTCGNRNCGGGDSEIPSVSSSTFPVVTTTTKVTATANIKVQVHTTPMSRKSTTTTTTTTTSSSSTTH